MKQVRLEFPEFLTHVQQSKKTFIKIGFNKIYTSSHYTIRNKIVEQVHAYLLSKIPNGINVNYPLKTHLEIHVPKNYGNVKRLKGEINWKESSNHYVPNWDIDNLAFLWIKCFNDCMIKKGILPDDTIQYLIGTSYEYVECKDIKDRKLVYYLNFK